MAKMQKPPKGMIKLSTKPKVEKPNKVWHWDERPSIEVDEHELPSVKNMNGDDEVVLHIKAYVERYNSDINHETGKRMVRVGFRVTEIGVVSVTPKKEKK